jgi:Helix-turn-helix domain
VSLAKLIQESLNPFMSWKFHLTDTDLTRIRFAFSPLWECISSLRVLRDPALGALHLPWIKETRRATMHLNLEPLLSLVLEPSADCNYIPDFLTPPPSTPFPDFRAELEEMCRSPHEVVRQNIQDNYRGHNTPIPTATQALLETPQAALDDLAQQLEAYWTVALEPHWPRLRLLLEGDVMLRARHLALGGAALLFQDLHSSLAYRDNILEKQQPLEAGASCGTDVYPAGRGLVVVPSVFVGPTVMTMKDEPWQPTLIYPARGSANLWGNASPDTNLALEALLGSGCARVLEALRVPTGTVELAMRLRVAPGNISHHLKRLTRAGLVESQRQGRVVFYRHSSRAEELLGVFA